MVVFEQEITFKGGWYSRVERVRIGIEQITVSNIINGYGGLFDNIETGKPVSLNIGIAELYNFSVKVGTRLLSACVNLYFVQRKTKNKLIAKYWATPCANRF